MTQPILEFDSDDPEFGRGFEAGRIWELLKGGTLSELRDQPIHAANAEMIMRMLEALDLTGIVTHVFSPDENWLFLRTL